MKVFNLIFKTFLAISLLVSFAFIPNLALAGGGPSVKIQFDCGLYINEMDIYEAIDEDGVVPSAGWECDPKWISEPTSYENACNIMNASPTGAVYIILFGMKTRSDSCSYE